MANAHGAVLQALRPIAAVSLPDAGHPRQHGHARWQRQRRGLRRHGRQLPLGGDWPRATPPVIQNADAAHASVVAPKGSAIYMLRLTVTDDAGPHRQRAGDRDLEPGELGGAGNAGDSACLTPVSYRVNSAPDGRQRRGYTAGRQRRWRRLPLELLSLLVDAVPAGARARARRYASFCAASSHSRCARR